MRTKDCQKTLTKQEQYKRTSALKSEVKRRVNGIHKIEDVSELGTNIKDVHEENDCKE